MKSCITILAVFTILGCSVIGHTQEAASADKKPALLSPYNTENMLGFSGIDIGLKYGHYSVVPRDPYTGTSTLQPYAGVSPSKVIQRVNMYSLDVQLYGSLVGRLLLKKKDRRFIVADISELGFDLGYASESGKEFDGTPIHSIQGKPGPNHTIVGWVNLGIGVLAAYRINDHMRASLRYQYLIDDGVIFYSWIGLDKFRNLDVSRRRLTGTFSYKEYLVEANLGMGWKYGGSVHGNNSWGIGARKRVGDNKHLGVKFDLIHHRKGPESGTRNLSAFMVYYGVGI